jgi:hypothetical protein
LSNVLAVAAGDDGIKIPKNNDATAIADCYLAAMQRKGYSFLSKNELSRRRDQVFSASVKCLRKPLDDGTRAAVLAGIDRSIDRLYSSPAGKISYGNGFGSGGEEWMYLNDRDFFLTFQYHLWVGLTSRPLSPADAKRLEAQHQWMRQYLANRPIQANQEAPPLYGKPDSEIRSWAMAELETAFADPLNLMSVPMPDEGFTKLQERFKQFSNGIAADIHDMEVAALTSRFPSRKNDTGRAEETYTGQLPFDDKVVTIWGNGPSLHYASNSVFRGNYGSLSQSTVYDVLRCTLVPPASAADGRQSVDRARPIPPGAEMEAWLAQEGRGELTLDGTNLLAVRGAKIANLSVKNWFEADRLSNDKLRATIRDGGTNKISVSGLPRMNGPHREDRSEGEFFAVVQTREDGLAVINLSNYEFGLAFWCRPRATKPATAAPANKP